MEQLRELKPILFVFPSLVLVSCFSKHYTSIFGDYTYHDVRSQYELLFDMSWSEIEKFIRFDSATGECFADVHKLKEILKKKGVTIQDIYERYCRDERIKVPFPQLVDYSLNKPVSLKEVLCQ